MKARLHRLTLRRVLTVLGAYLVLLHGIAMGVMLAPVAADAASLFPICSTHTDGNGTAPGHSPAEHAPCALCGLGACFAVEAPPVALPASFSQGLFVPPLLPGEAAPSPARIQASQPRGPPL